MNTIQKSIQKIPQLKVLGRVPPFSKETGALHTFWTGSGIECAIKARELWIELDSNYTLYESWVSVFINGAWISRFIPVKGKQWYCIARNMNPLYVQNIRILKDVQAMPGDDNHVLSFCTLKIITPYTDEKDIFIPINKKNLAIEFIGDSITSGEGTIGAQKEMDWIPMWFTCANTYAYKIATNLNADFRFISQSGWGVYCAWDNNIHCTLPKYYEKICGLATGDIAKSSGAHKKNDFNNWQPDIIVINLGTNDTGSFSNPGWTDPETGIVYKQRINPDGTYNIEDTTKFTKAAFDFLLSVRKHNPTSKIIWAYGMIGKELTPYILEAITMFKKERTDNSVFFLPLPNMEPYEIGSRGHPGLKAHTKTAEVLSEYIKSIL